jgi:hypothetical protein
MPMYELVLRFPDGREEIRVTDGHVALGTILEIDYADWTVVLERDPEDIRAIARYLCELAKEQRSRAVKMRADDAERRQRLEQTRAWRDAAREREDDLRRARGAPRSTAT